MNGIVSYYERLLRCFNLSVIEQMGNYPEFSIESIHLIG